MLDLTLASGNQGKVRELNELFSLSMITVKSAPETLDVVEDGKTFRDNALLKAKAYFEKFQTPVISDDSGLIVEALPNELGVYSARFGVEGSNYSEKCQLLLQKLEKEENRKAKFVCTLCVYLNSNEIYFFEGELHGNISREAKGDGGFGFDPVFIPSERNDEKTLAELNEWKQKNSHRAKATENLQNFFKRSIVNT